MTFRDPIAATTHLSMGVFALYALILMMRLSRDEPEKRRYLAVYGVSMVFLYFASGIYHAIPAGNWWLEPFRRLDHSGIYGLIAGTYTPVVGILLRPPMRERMLQFIWGLALLGVIGKWLPAVADWLGGTNGALPLVPHSLTVSIYLGMGWLGLLPVRQYWRTTGPRGMMWALAGGIAYSAGAACELAKWPVLAPGLGYHETMHVFDMLGTALHFVYVVGWVWPYRTHPTPGDS